MSASEPDTRGTPFVPAWVAVMAVGLLTGLQPLSTDLYLPALPEMQRALSLTSPQVQWTLSVLILAFGICFQLPVILTLLAQIDLVHVDLLKKGRRYAIVGILIFAAFITPPDPISQIGLAVPMYLLYELSIISVRMVEKRRAAALAAQEAEISGSSSSE